MIESSPMSREPKRRWHFRRRPLWATLLTTAISLTIAGPHILSLRSSPPVTHGTPENVVSYPLTKSLSVYSRNLQVVPAGPTPQSITDGRVTFSMAGAPPREPMQLDGALTGAKGSTYAVSSGNVVTAVLILNLPQTTGVDPFKIADAFAAGIAADLGVPAATGVQTPTAFGSTVTYTLDSATAPATATVIVTQELVVAVVDTGIGQTLPSTEVWATLTIDNHKVLG